MNYLREPGVSKEIGTGAWRSSVMTMVSRRTSQGHVESGAYQTVLKSALLHEESMFEGLHLQYNSFDFYSGERVSLLYLP